MTSSKLLKLLRSDTLVVERDGAVACAKAAQELIAFVIATYRRDGQIVLPEFKKLAEILAEGLTIADLLGYARTMSLAGIELTRTHGKMLGVLRRRLKTDPAALVRLEANAQATALRVMSRVRAATEKKLQRALLVSATKGEHVRAGVKRLKRAFDVSGITPRHKSHLETIYRTQTRMAYSAGRYQAEQHEAVQEILWGYRYVTTGDDRVRENHIGLHGTVAPKDDPIWAKITPPNGWNCRCELVPLFRKTKIRMPPKTAVPDRGFSFNPGTVFTPAEDLRYKLGEATGRYVSGAAHFTTPTGEIVPYPDEIRKAWAGKSKTEARRIRKDYIKGLEARRKAGVKDPHLPGIMTKAPAPTPVVEIKIPAPVTKAPVDAEQFVQRRFRVSAHKPTNITPSLERSMDRQVKKVAAAQTDLAERFPELIKIHGRDRLNVRLLSDFTLVPGRGVTGTYGRDRGIRLAARNSKRSNITLGKFNTDSSLSGVYRHEYGHHVYRSSSHVLKSDWSRAYKDLPDVKKTLSTYAKTNAEEGFSEAFAVYTHPKYARGMLPANLEKVFDDLLKIKVKAPVALPPMPIRISVEDVLKRAGRERTALGKVTGKELAQRAELQEKIAKAREVITKDSPGLKIKVVDKHYDVIPMRDPSTLFPGEISSPWYDPVAHYKPLNDQPKEVGKWLKKLNFYEKEAFESYIHDPRLLAEQTLRLSRALARAPKARGTFYRGMHHIKDPKKFVKGATINLEKATSISRNPVVADAFAEAPTGKSVFMEIRAKNAIDIRSCSVAFNEEEFLLQARTKLRILSTTTKGNRIYIVCEEVEIKMRLGEATGKFVSGAARYTSPTGEILEYPVALVKKFKTLDKSAARKMRKVFVRDLNEKLKVVPTVVKVPKPLKAPKAPKAVKVPKEEIVKAPKPESIDKTFKRAAVEREKIMKEYSPEDFATRLAKQEKAAEAREVITASSAGPKIKVVDNSYDVIQMKKPPTLLGNEVSHQTDAWFMPLNDQPKEVGAWTKKLTSKEVQAFQNYTLEGSKEGLQFLDNALARAPKARGTFYRGLNNVKDPKSFKVGAYINFDDAQSLTRNPLVADKFAPKTANSVFMEIRAKTAVDIRACSPYINEEEFLLRAKTKLKIISSTTKMNRIHIVCEEVVPKVVPKAAIPKVIRVRAPAPARVSVESVLKKAEREQAGLKKLSSAKLKERRLEQVTQAKARKIVTKRSPGPKIKVVDNSYDVIPMRDPPVLTKTEMIKRWSADYEPLNDQPKAVGKWLKELSFSEREVFKTYTRGEYVRLTQARQLNKALARAPRARGTFYRGMNAIKDPNKFVKGATIKCDEVMSISRSPLIADSFAKGTHRQNVFMEIRTKSAIDIRSCTPFMQEEEFLLRPKTKLKILSSTTKGNRIHVVCEEVEAVAKKVTKAVAKKAPKVVAKKTVVKAPKPVASSYVDDALKRATKEKEELDTLSSAQLEKRKRQAQRRAGSKPKVVDDRYEVAPMKQPSTAYPIEPYAGWTEDAGPRWKDQPKEVGKWFKKQSYEENMALGSFTEGGGFDAKFLDVALSKAPKARGTFYRGMYDVKSPKSFAKGAVVNLKNATSMSRSPVVADEFAKVSAKGKSVFMEIRAKNAVDVRSNSNWYQQEFVLREKTKLKITSSMTKGDRIYVTCEEM